MERGWLVDERELHARRAPGNSCLSALQASKGSSAERGTPRRRINNSKGCGGVMRMAPAGLTEGLDPFDTGCELAAITHGHPTGHLAAGAFAQLIHALSAGEPLEQAIDATLARSQGEEATETREALEQAVELARHAEGTAEDVERLGPGWIAEEALAIGVFCALTARDFAHGVLLAVNHGGDSDSTGSVAGNILGLIHGVATVLPGVSLVGNGKKLLCSTQQIDGVGAVDMLCHVETNQLELTTGSASAVLTATTSSGAKIRGADSVTIVP